MGGATSQFIVDSWWDEVLWCGSTIGQIYSLANRSKLDYIQQVQNRLWAEPPWLSWPCSEYARNVHRERLGSRSASSLTQNARYEGRDVSEKPEGEGCRHWGRAKWAGAADLNAQWWWGRANRSQRTEQSLPK